MAENESAGDSPEESFPEAGETMASLMAEADSREARKTSGIRWAPVVQVLQDQVLVDVGEKREGSVPLSDFGSGAPGAAPEGLPKVGDRIPVVMVRSGSGLKPGVFSHLKARVELAWQELASAFEKKTRVRGKVISVIKGGYLVDLGGLNGFLPASLADLRPVRKPEILLNTGVRCYVIELNAQRKQAVLSRKAVLEEETNLRKAKAMSELRVGQICIARIVREDPSGLFVDVGGLEGFVAAEDAAWGPAKPPSGFERGSKVKAKILRLPAQGERIPLGIKQLSPNPAWAMAKKHPAKSVVAGEVREATPAGLVLRLKDSTPAFCRQADCPEGSSWKEGDRFSAVVLGVDDSNLRINVSIARFEDIEDRKRVKGYLKPPPPLTLGQLLSPDDE